MLIHFFFCLYPLGLTIKLNLINMSKVAYYETLSDGVYLTMPVSKCFIDTLAHR